MKRGARVIALMGILVLSLAAVPSASADDGAKVDSLTVLDPLNGRAEVPLSNEGRWAALAWDNSSTGHNTGRTTNAGWRPYDMYPTINGAYWTGFLADKGGGIGAELTMAVAPGVRSRYVALWIDMANPGSGSRRGYQLRWVQAAEGVYDIVLCKWEAGIETVLASKSAVPIPNGTALAIVSHGGTVSAWAGSSTMSKLLSASDSTYSSGYSGLEGSGELSRSIGFKAGALPTSPGTPVPPEAPVLSWTDPVSPGATRLPRVAGSGKAGTTVRLYANAACAGSPVATGTAAAFASPGLVVSVPEGSTTSFYATATDGEGNASPCSTSSIAYTEDSKEIVMEGSHSNEFKLLLQCGEAITNVPDPLGSGRTVLDFTVHNDDTVNNEATPGCTPTGDPRAEAMSSEFIDPGDEFWLRGRFLIPEGFPSVSQWMTLAEIYGKPFAGTSPWRLAVQGNEFRYQRDATYGWDIPWSAPETKGKWTEFMLHERFGYDGWLELWWNGVKQKFFGGSGWFNPHGEPTVEKLSMSTMDSSNNGAPNSLRIGQYRAVNMFEVGSIYFQFVKMGTTRASVGG